MIIKLLHEMSDDSKMPTIVVPTTEKSLNLSKTDPALVLHNIRAKLLYFKKLPLNRYHSICGDFRCLVTCSEEKRLQFRK